MFLRSKRYDAYNAAMLLLKFYETKRRLWDVTKLARRISWDDLSEETRALNNQYCGIYLPRNGESNFRQVWYYRSSFVDPNGDPMDQVRVHMYSFFCYPYGKEEAHRKGQIVISDLRGPFKMSPIQYLDFCRITVPMYES